ncbi:Laminin subunit beta-1 [Bienertia sinuspersici]
MIHAGGFPVYSGWHYRIFGCSCRPTSRGLGLLRAIPNWKHLISGSGCGKHCTRTSPGSN